MENGSFIDGLPIKNGDFHIVMLVYQRVNLHFPMVFLWFKNIVICQYLSLPEGTTYNLQTKISPNSVWTRGWRDHAADPPSNNFSASQL